MDLEKLFQITSKLQQQAIGEPVWIPEKKTFEYVDQSVKVVAVLKAIRAVQGVKSMHLLCGEGLFIDMGTLYRCVNDCTAEIYFLFENYPKTSNHVNQFVKAFFEATSDNYLDAKTEQVLVKKIHSAVVRVLTGREQDEKLRKIILNIYKTFSGYVHANYVHILEIYGGNPRRFNLAGVPSTQVRKNNMQLVEAAYISVLHSMGFLTHKLGMIDLYNEILEC